MSEAIADPDVPGLAARGAAAALLAGVIDRGFSLADQTAAADGPLAGLAPADRARAQALVTATLRHLGKVDAVLAPFLARPPVAGARHALRLAVTEICLDGVPAHAAVDGAVRLARRNPKSAHLAGLVNAVGRRVSEQGLALWAEAAEAPLPAWIAGPLRRAHGARALGTIAAAHAAGPVPVDLTPRDPAEAPLWAERLGAELLPTGSLRLRERVQLSTLPGYEDGAWWVQDAAAALPARLLGDVAGRRVLDLCAAPGGKTLQLAAAGAAVTALDSSETRLVRLRENLARMALAAEVVTADARNWEPAAPFDAILLDAPCSATGTIRRHPDLPYLREGAEVGALGAIQAALLERAFGWLAPGGRLVYCVCSLLPAEGEGRIARFLKDRPEARRVPVPEGLGLDPAWVTKEGALRTRPDFWAERGGMDGFYAAVLERGA